jgi:predicted NBD/HSP70 family sugar kinase
VGVSGNGTQSRSGLTGSRDRNARKVLGALLEQPEGLTQLEIADANGLVRSTVSTLLSQTLLPVLSFSEREEGERGPPPLVWSVARDAAYSAGVDIGKSHVSVVLADPYGEVVGGPEWAAMPNTMDDPTGTLDLAGRLLGGIVGDASRCRRIAALMVGLPGVADAERGLLIDAAAPGWREFHLPEQVAARWPFAHPPKVYVENDANLGALGELHGGAGRESDSLLFIKWSTGIGSGLVLERRLWRGKSGAAGELGHLTVNPSKADREALRLPPRSVATPCPRCEQRDCIERIAGGPAIANALGVEDFRAVLRQAEDSDPRQQRRARLALSTAAKLIGMAIGPALTLLNVERVVVGGLGGADAYPLVVESLRRGVDRTAPPQARADAEIEPGELGGDAYVLGAAAAAFERRGIDFLVSRARAVATEAGAAAGRGR